MVKKTEATQPENMETGNVDQIRDILFGAQMRDYEQRFSRLEERVLNESDALRSETNNRLDALEDYIKQEVSSLVDQISNERGEREDDTRHLTDELNKNIESIDKKISQVQDKLTQGQGESREALLEQSKSLLAEIQSVRTSLTEQLNKNTDKLEHNKTDRKALADMFSEVAMRLNGEFNLPEGKAKKS
jgi:DNA repair exonuclease SbcCD ATPase subunit